MSEKALERPDFVFGLKCDPVENKFLFKANVYVLLLPRLGIKAIGLGRGLSGSGDIA